MKIVISLYSCSTSPPGGNQVDGLPPATHLTNASTVTTPFFRLVEACAARDFCSVGMPCPKDLFFRLGVDLWRSCQDSFFVLPDAADS